MQERATCFIPWERRAYIPDAKHRMPFRGLAAVLAEAGIEVALVDQSRPDFGLPVVRAIAPHLQPMPSQIVTRRLQTALTETGGGARFTHGVPLF